MSLDQKIEMVREQMMKLAAKRGFQDKHVIALSEELDILINQKISNVIRY